MAHSTTGNLGPMEYVVWVDTGDIIFSSKVRSQRDCPKLLEIAYFTREGMR